MNQAKYQIGDRSMTDDNCGYMPPPAICCDCNQLKKLLTVHGCCFKCLDLRGNIQFRPTYTTLT